MLTFSEALVLLKSGEDMRHEDWPKRDYVRATRAGASFQLTRFSAAGRTTYTPTQPELFSQHWSKA
jgi:hypothetical protein